MSKLTHFGAHGQAHMVDVAAKDETHRVAVATGRTAMRPATFRMVVEGSAAKGDVLGVAPDEVTVIAGDTEGTPLGLGAFASRQAVTAGNAVHLAAIAVRDKAIKAAAEMLEAAPDDLELKDGAVQVKGVPQMKIALHSLKYFGSLMPASRKSRW